MANFGTFSTLGLQKRLRHYAAIATPITPVSKSFQSSFVQSPTNFGPIELAGSVVEHFISLVSNTFSASGARSYIPKRLYLAGDPTFLCDITLLVDTVGNRLAIPVIHRLPSIIALDGVDPSFFSNNREGIGKQTFRGNHQSPVIAAAGVSDLNVFDAPNIEIKNISNSSSLSSTLMGNQASSYLDLSIPNENKTYTARLHAINSASLGPTKPLKTIIPNSLFDLDLIPYAPLGWDAPLIVTAIPGSLINGQAITTADTPNYYVCFFNNGYDAVINSFKYTLSIDGIISVTWSENRAIYSGVYVAAGVQGPPLSAGTHQATLTVDSQNTVQETNENNNVFNYAFTVLGTTPPPTLSINDISINEGSGGVGIATFTVTLSTVAISNVTVNYATANGTGSSAAVAPDDYTLSSGSLTFTPGQTSKTISVTIIGDAVVEPNEAFFVNLSGATNATIADYQGVGTILDDDSTPPVITVVATDANAAETVAGATANPGVYTLTRSVVTASPLTVNVSMSGAAINGTDYASIPTAVIFAANSSTAIVSLAPIDDTLLEQPESASLTIGAGAGYTIGTVASATATIADNDLGSIAIAKTTDGSETGPLASVFTLTRTGSSASALNVIYTLGGTAARGLDYTGTSPGTATFAAGSATKTIILPTINDVLVDSNETIIATITAPTGYIISGPASATATIADNDLGSIAIAKTTDGSETGPLASVFTLTRTGSSAAALNVSYTLGGAATQGLDYTGTSPGTAAFAAGSATTTITLPTINDALVDPNETIIATITAPTGYIISGPASATATIADNDLGSIAIAKTTDGSETGPLASVFTLTRTGSSAAALNVSYTLGGAATQGLDYTGTSPGTAAFAAGSATTTITLPTINDVLVDPNETIIAAITAPTGYIISGPASATATIADNEPVGQSVVTLASNYSGVSENGAPNLIYTFTRSGATTGGLGVNFTVEGTATQGTDFLATGAILSGTNGIINFAAGSAIAILTVNPIADTFKEVDEAVILNLVAGTGYQVGTPTPVTTTIINDDETLNQRGTPGNDYIEAGQTLVLSGRSGNDVLIGSRANDILSGGLGSDTLTGGAGSDLFCFSTPQDGSDRITDFNPLEDLIQITAVGFAGNLIAGETLMQPQFSLGAVTAATRFIFNPVSGTLFFDSDGSGAATAFQLASLNSGLTLTNENFFVS